MSAPKEDNAQKQNAKLHNVMFEAEAEIPVPVQEDHAALFIEGSSDATEAKKFVQALHIGNKGRKLVFKKPEVK
jgi:hypothetical protein